MSRKISTPLTIFTLLAITACGGTTEPSELPEHPGEAGRLTLEGIDMDLDGVRDDVQIHIHEQNHDLPDVIAPLLHMAKYRQQAIIDYDDDGVLEESYLDTHLHTMECIKLIDPAGYGKRITLLEQATLNTGERWKTALRLDAAIASGQAIARPSVTVLDCQDVMSIPASDK